MASFDDAMKNAVPGGNLATPIAVAVGALILGKMFGGSSAPASAPAVPIPPPGQPVPTNAPAGSILGGLTDLIGKLSAGGVSPQGNSWVGQETHRPGAARTARFGARPECAGGTFAAHRHEPARIAEPALDCVAADHQSYDAKR